MIVHIVFFRFKEEDKQKNMDRVKSDLEALQMDGLIKLEVGREIVGSERSWDMSLYSEFATQEDLEAYQVFEPHVKAVTFIKQVCSEIAAVDYIK